MITARDDLETEPPGTATPAAASPTRTPRSADPPSGAGDRLPASIAWAYAMVIVGTLAAIASNVFEIGHQLDTGSAGAATTADLVLTIAFCAMFGFFAEMLRKGRQWGRVMLAVFTALGILFTGLGLAGLGGRPIVGGVQVVLAWLSFVASVLGLVCMFLPSANAFVTAMKDRNRQISQRLRKIILTAHVAISVGWLGLVTGMFALAVTGATTSDRGTQFAMYTTMSLLDEIFLGMTSMFALVSGVIGAAGTKWGLMQRWWVAVKFVVTILLMMFGFGAIHSLILEANTMVLAGDVPVRGPDADAVGTALASCAGVALCVLVFMTILSTFKPWGMTRRGRKVQTAPRSRKA